MLYLGFLEVHFSRVATLLLLLVLKCTFFDKSVRGPSSRFLGILNLKNKLALSTQEFAYHNQVVLLIFFEDTHQGVGWFGSGRKVLVFLTKKIWYHGPKFWYNF